MAVVQISRIQVRRGKATGGTGLPQLASGEIAWAIDTQQIFIGNGAVSEGAPAVGNTRLLTEYDLTSYGNLLSSLKYTYKVNDTVVTGPSSNFSVERTFQEQFDDNVNLNNFIYLPDGIPLADDYDYADTIQRAIDQLFLNSSLPASHTYSTEFPTGTPDAVRTRVTLTLPAGIYNTSKPIYIPSYATIVGAGQDKTIIVYNGTDGPAIQFVNDDSTIGDPQPIESTISSHRPRNITFSNMTIHSTSGESTCLKLDAVCESLFENLYLQGDWNNTWNEKCIGIDMQANALTTCENNIFRNIHFTSFAYGVFTKFDIMNNIFENCYFNDALIGVSLGAPKTNPVTGVPVSGSGPNTLTAGELYGARQTQINSCKFYNIKRQAVYIGFGHGNSTSNNKLIMVGNDGAGQGNAYAQYPQMYFETFGNSSNNDYSDRAIGNPNSVLSVDGLMFSTTHPYPPELGGHGVYKGVGMIQRTLAHPSSPQFLFRLPVSTNDEGTPTGIINYTIEYSYQSTVNSFSRRGTMTISADVGSAGPTLTRPQLTDEFDFNGIDSLNLTSIALDFSIGYLNESGNVYTGAGGFPPYSIAVYYKNSPGTDQGYFNFSYTSIQ